MQKILMATLVGLALMLSLVETACALERVRLAQFGQAKFLFYLPLYVAMEEGYFEDNGISLELNFAGNDDQIFASLVSGSADFAMGDPIFSAIAAERGFRAKTVALMAQRLAVFGYTNRKDIPYVRTASGLAGLRVGSFPAPSTTFTFLETMRKGLPAGQSFSIVGGAQGTMLPMLTAGQLDIAIDLEPAASIAESQGSSVVFAMTDFSEKQAVTGLMTTERLIETQPETVQRMLKSLEQGLAALHKDSDTGVQTAIRIFPDISPEILRRAVKRLLASDCYPRTTVIADSDWQRSIETRLKSGDLKKPQATSEAVENRFAERARASISR